MFCGWHQMARYQTTIINCFITDSIHKLIQNCILSKGELPYFNQTSMFSPVRSLNYESRANGSSTPQGSFWMIGCFNAPWSLEKKKKTPTLTRVDSLVGRRGIGPCKDHLDHISVASGGFHFRWLPYPPGNGERKPIPPKRGSWENHRFKGFPSCYMILVGLNFNPIFSHFFF